MNSPETYNLENSIMNYERLASFEPALAEITLEQAADVVNMLAWKIWRKHPHSRKEKVYQCEYH